MNGGFPVANLFGIEVRVSLTLAIMVGIVALIGAEQAAVMAPGMAGILHWVVGIVVALLFLVSVGVHEFAHALVGRRRGVATTSMVLGLVGSLAPLSIETRRPGDEFAIAVSGPIASILIGAALAPLGIALGFVGTPVGPMAGGLFVVGALNLMIGLASLIPGMPMDGGRIVRSIVWRRTGDPDRATLATAHSGRFLAWGVVAVGVVRVLMGDAVLGLLLAALGWLFNSVSRSLEDRARMEHALRGVTVREAMLADVAQVAPGLTLDTFAGRLGVDGEPRALPVVDGDRVLGVIGATAVRRVPRRRAALTRAGDAMAVPPRAPLLAPDASLWGAMEAMQRSALDGLAVVEDGRLIGVLTRDSAADAIRSRMPAELFWRGRRR